MWKTKAKNGGKISLKKQITHQIIFSHEKILQKIEFHVKKEFEMHIKMVQAFVNFRLVVLLMNKKDGGERIKQTAIKKEAKKQ